MPLTSLTLRFGALSRLATLAAVTTVLGCAASDTSGVDPGEGTDSAVKTDAPSTTDTGGAGDTARPDTSPSGSDAGSDGGGTCVSSCTSDDQCASSCPAAGSGSNCCDTATGVCYVSADSTCPAGATDTGVTPPY